MQKNCHESKSIFLKKALQKEICKKSLTGVKQSSQLTKSLQNFETNMYTELAYVLR